jgi:hypothetical protein
VKHSGVKLSDIAGGSASFRARNPDLLPAAAPAAVFGERRIRQRQAPKLNLTEIRLREWLKGPHCIGERIYEQAITLELATGMTYRPDFFVAMPRYFEDGKLESIGTFYECKGKKAWDDAIAKLKTAAREWPCFTFFLAWESEGNWKLQKILP